MIQQEKTDKRIVKTKQNIYDAFFSLTESPMRGFLTVSEICKIAGINRNTFYCHYNDIDDLFDEISAGFIVRTKEIYGAEFSFLERNIAICRLYAEHRALVKILLNPQFNIRFMKKLEGLAFEHTFQVLKNRESIYDESEYELVAGYIIYGSLAAIIRWIDNGMDKTPEEMGRILTMLMTGETI